MLENDKVRLRAVEPEDLDLMYLVENDTALWPCGATTVPLSRHALRQYIEESRNDFFLDGQLRLVIETADGVACGFVDLTAYDALHHRAEVGIVVIPSMQQRGYASVALNLVRDYAKRLLGLHQLYAYVPEGNVASIALFKASGYQQTATLQDWIHTPDGWRSVHVLQQLL